MGPQAGLCSNAFFERQWQEFQVVTATYDDGAQFVRVLIQDLYLNSTQPMRSSCCKAYANAILEAFDTLWNIDSPAKKPRIWTPIESAYERVSIPDLNAVRVAHLVQLYVSLDELLLYSLAAGAVTVCAGANDVLEHRIVGDLISLPPQLLLQAAGQVHTLAQEDGTRVRRVMECTGSLDHGKTPAQVPLEDQLRGHGGGHQDQSR